MTKNQQYDRRTVLKTISAAGAVGGFSSAVAAESTDAVRVVEAGLRYEVPDIDDVEYTRVDSRPPFTVQKRENRLLLLKTASQTFRSRVRQSPELAGERPAETGEKVPLTAGKEKIADLPTELSARMRAKRRISLESTVSVPQVVLHPKSEAVDVSIQSEGKVSVGTAERREVRLDRHSATVRTSRVSGEASDEDIPDYLLGLEREYGTEEVEVRPVVELVNHGTVQVAQQPDKEVGE